jgi:hypothetical protein
LFGDSPEIEPQERNMLFRTDTSGSLAISQLTHAWISGQILRVWNAPLCEPLLLAAEQHDIGWVDWEITPSFNPQTGLPHLFRDVGASVHAPMWAKGVERALHAWGAHVALLISRHGGVIYRRYTDRHRIAEADAAAADRYLEMQAPLQAEWARALGLDAERLKAETMLLVLADALSLALCGELKAPLEVEAPEPDGGTQTLRLTELPGDRFDFSLSPWPFRADVVTVEGEASRLPPEGRFADEVSMRAWLARPERCGFHARLLAPSKP